MFYLTTLNTFYLSLYGIKHMVKDHTDSKRRNLLPLHGLLFPISSSKGSFICIIPQTMAFVTPVVEHWLEREIAQGIHQEGLIRRPIAPWANSLTTELHLAPKEPAEKLLLWYYRLFVGILIQRAVYGSINKYKQFFWYYRLFLGILIQKQFLEYI